MICKNCGWQNETGSRFCEKCGQATEPAFTVSQESAPQAGADSQNAYGYFGRGPEAAPPVVSMWPPVQMPPVQAQPEKKKKTGLIIGLATAGALVIIAVILIAVLSGASPLQGVWYCEDLGVALEFERGGLVVSYTPEGNDEGNYTFNSNSNKGTIEADGEDFDFRLDGRRIQVQGIGTFEKAGKHFDIQDFIEGYPKIPDELQGTWYEADGYGYIEFSTDDVMVITIMDNQFEGEYTFDSDRGRGTIAYEGEESSFTCDGTTLEWEGSIWTLNYVEQIEYDWDSMSGGLMD